MMVSRHYFNNWVQTVVDRTDVHVGEIFFPAVSVCPLIGINWTKLPEVKTYFLGSNFTTAEEKTFQKMLGRLSYLQQFNDLGADARRSSWEPSSQTHGILFDVGVENVWNAEDTHYTLNEIQKLLAYNCSYLFEKCFWRNVELPCCGLFQITTIYNSYCFSFNMIGEKQSNETSLRTSFGPGPNNGLRVLVKRIDLEKFMIAVHEPSMEPDSQSLFLEGKRTIITVNPVRFKSDPEIATVAPILRRCYFTDEMEKMGVTESACKRICRLNYLLAKCNCTLPSNNQNNGSHTDNSSTLKETSEFCAIKNKTCLSDLENYGSANESSSNQYEEMLYASGLNCSCYHNCDYIEYAPTVYLESFE
ncbi:pickpocket protein 19 [Ceratitis capitata]|uniref:pickpocket protein 19 n=1 Tax=Ceratitis capitata TaxID=7213 RepID=UPI000A105CA2|nr:pickpocket protein 19 [Ceratitis capitata]